MGPNSIIRGFRQRPHDGPCAVSFIAENWILIAVAFISGAMLVWPMVNKAAGGGTTVASSEAVRLINREKGVLIDVSEAAEFAQGHARGARHIPFGQLEGSKDLPSNKALPVIVLCPTGARAGRAAGLLRKAGYEKAVAVSGGTAAWREAQLPMEKAAEALAQKSA
jgi:rhodanese-related sulfurtransferase